jgi:Photosynthetic reaction centre cytochrome C subunit
LLRRSAVLFLFVTIVGCAAVRQQKSMPASSDDLQFHNLRVLSPTITHDELIATMRGYARALGTRCEHCHVQTATEPKDEFDFPKDAKPEKRVARTMIAMTRMINTQYVSKVNEHGPTVTCLTCHRGRTVPDTTIAPQPERRGGAPGAAPGNPTPNAQPTPPPSRGS